MPLKSEALDGDKNENCVFQGVGKKCRVPSTNSQPLEESEPRTYLVPVTCAKVISG